jgi:hypothetical protein
MDEFHNQLLALSARIVAAHVAHNEVPAEALAHMIRNTYSALSELGGAPHPLVGHDDLILQTPEAHVHAHDEVQHASHAENAYVHPVFGETLYADHLVCIECGMTMKMLKRHLQTVHGLTPAEYRDKWRLPSDYPMVAAEYAKLRSSLARESGLGLKPEDRTSKGRKGRV